MPMSKESPPPGSGIPMLVLWLFRIELIGWIVGSLVWFVMLVGDPWGSGCSQRRFAEKDIANLQSSVEMYRLSKDRCPESTADLHEAGIISKITKDPWGNDYALICAGVDEQVFIMSAGPDGRFGSKDDIKSWDSDP